MAGLLAIGFIFGWVTRFWNVRRFLVWLACFALAAGGIWGSSRYDRYLKEITLPEHFNCMTYLPFREGSPVKTLDGETSLRFADGGALPKMDGATALYPVYAAFAQAVYPPAMADKSSAEVLELVSCSTTCRAYTRIVDGGCDIIFAAGPSEEQEA